MTPPPSERAPEPASHADVEDLIRQLRQEVVYLRDTRLSSVPPASIRSRGRKALVGLVGASAATGVVAILTLLGGIAAKRWPAYAEVITGVLQALGAP